mmetsp:Transcript_22715/g.31142  ORF Transcript_22715/g.31142 Transcript_22715/m.31142 type:complete len:217 (+) Transcript_22715:751-1401(+)
MGAASGGVVSTGAASDGMVAAGADSEALLSTGAGSGAAASGLGVVVGSVSCDGAEETATGMTSISAGGKGAATASAGSGVGGAGGSSATATGAASSVGGVMGDGTMELSTGFGDAVGWMSSSGCLADSGCTFSSVSLFPFAGTRLTSRFSSFGSAVVFITDSFDCKGIYLQSTRTSVIPSPMKPRWILGKLRFSLSKLMSYFLFTNSRIQEQLLSC